MSTPTHDPALEALTAASSGLMLPSESDAPFEVVSWDLSLGQPSPEAARSFVKAPEAAPVKTETVDELLGPLGKDQSWHDEHDKAEAARFRELARVLSSELAEARVYRIGAADVTVLALGKTRDGRWVGLKSAVVET